MKLKTYILLGPLFLVMIFLGSLLGPLSAFAQSDIIQQVTENGTLSPLLKGGSGLSAPLFCQGALPCGTVLYTNLVMDPASNPSKIRFTAIVHVIMGSSSLTVNNALFVANSLAPLGVETVDPNSGNTPYAIFMSKHDPIQPGDGTGRFAEATKLTYRGLDEFKGLNIPQVLSRQSSYVISNGN